MKILVTGGAGFIGSNIVDFYIKEGHTVAVIDDLSTGKEKNLNPQAHFYKMDIGSSEVENIFQKEKFDIVNHHAAQIDVRKSVADPAYDAKINVLGTLNIFENCKKYKVKKIIFASSGGVMYGECLDIPPDENTPPAPLSPYGITKLVVEYYLNYYHYTFGISWTALRYGNVYGPRQDPFGEAGVVAIFSQRMLKNDEISIYGDGNQLRDYVYVEDVVKANLLALGKGDNQIFNIGTGNSRSVNELFEKLAKIAGYKEEPSYQPPRSGELFKSSLNLKKAKEFLGWKAEMDFEEGMRKTYEYFRTQMTADN